MKNTCPIALVGFLLFFSACSTCQEPEGDEKQIKNLVTFLLTAAENHDLASLTEPITQDFKVEPRGLSLSDIKKYLFVAFRKLGTFKIHYPEPTLIIEPDGMWASVKLTFLLLRKGESDTGLQALRSDPSAWLENVGKRARLYRAQLELIKKDSAWLVQSVQFERFRTTGFGP